MAHVSYSQLIDEVAIASGVPRLVVEKVLAKATVRIALLVKSKNPIKFVGFGTIYPWLRRGRDMVLKGDTTPTWIPLRYIAKFIPAENWLTTINPP